MVSSIASREESLVQGQQERKKATAQNKNGYFLCTLTLTGRIAFPGSPANQGGFLLGFLFYSLTGQFHDLGYLWGKAKR